MGNQTEVTEFIILGLSNDSQMQIFVFLVFSVVYLIKLLANMVIMLAIRVDPHLQIPMYFFLSHLSFVDICYSSAIVPNMLVHFLAEYKTISVNSCIAQMFFISLLAATEIFFLSAMASDRYAAICDPLHYMEIMSKGICVLLVRGAWTTGFFYALPNTVFTLKLHFCGSIQIYHFSCELPPLLQLACTVTLTNQVMLLTSVMIFASSSFLLTLISYIYIIFTILRICSAEGRRKAFSTCSSHLIVVGFWYLTAFFQYTKPSSVSSVVLDEMFSIQYSIINPMLNPIIYNLKNKDMKIAVGKTLGKFKFLK